MKPTTSVAALLTLTLLFAGCEGEQEQEATVVTDGLAGHRVIDAMKKSEGWQAEPALRVIYNRAVEASRIRADKVKVPVARDNDLSLYCASRAEQPICQSDIRRDIVWQ